MPFKASELKGRNRCYFRRTRNVVFENNKNEVFKKAVFQKTVTKSWFYAKKLKRKPIQARKAFQFIADGGSREDYEDTYFFDGVKTILKACGKEASQMTADEFNELLKKSGTKPFIEKVLKEGFLDMNFETDETAVLLAERAAALIMRYVKNEPRDPVMPETETVDMFGLIEVTCKPDLLFVQPDGDVEAVKLCFRLPDVTQTGKLKDKSVLNSLELYALWKYALAYPGADPAKAKSSYYFMRRADDRRDFSNQFFGSNVVTLQECIAPKGDTINAIFEPQVEEFVMGEECSGDTCDGCDFNHLCNFSNAPLKSEEKKTKKSVRDIALSDEQERAVYFRKGIARVNAGAGAGKTLIVALRTAFMLDEGISPEDMLLITFTEAGAKEMLERVEMYDEDLGNGTDMEKIHCMTFNAFGDAIVRKEYETLGFDHEPRLIDNIERKQIISELLGKYTISGLDYANFSMNGRGAKGALAVCEKAFEIIKRDRLSTYSVDELIKAMPPQCRGSISNDLAYQEMLDLYNEYDEILKAKCLIEYSDQERLIFDLLEIDPYYFDENLPFKHITIDEFQDTSPNQIEIVKKLIDCDSFESLMVVGDDSQSIYGFRGADSANIIDFFDLLNRDGEDIYITKNYRSDPAILDFANELNALNTKRIMKDLIATKLPNGKTPVVKGFHTTAKEYEYIANLIKEKKENGENLDDIAILAYSRSELLKIASALTEAGIENVLRAPEPMLENSRVQGLIAFGRAYLDKGATKDIVTFENCIHGGNLISIKDEEFDGIVQDGINEIEAIQRSFGPDKTARFEDVANRICGDDELALNLTDRLKRFREIEDKIDYLLLFDKFDGEAQKRDGSYSGVTITTAHSSKGLEWPVVIASVTKFYEPSLGFNDVEERRRLFFVSATRAKEELYITGQVKAGGTKKSGYVYNPFLQEAAKITGTTLEYFDKDVENKNKKDKEEAKKRLQKKKEEAVEAVEKTAKQKTA